MYIQRKLTFLVLLCSFCNYFFASAQGKKELNDSLKKSSKLNIGLYAGVSNSLTSKASNVNLFPSFLIYGQTKLSKKWELMIGIGESFYSGKSLNYTESKILYDTLELKKNTIQTIGYLTVPVLLKFKVSPKSSLIGGLRWSYASYVEGTGGYYISWTKKDSFVYLSSLSPKLPSQANKIDIGAVLGYQFSFTNHFMGSVMFNLGMVPVFPSSFKEDTGEHVGLYNVSAEIGLHYLFFNYLYK
jgi:hypothetical protein